MQSAQRRGVETTPSKGSPQAGQQLSALVRGSFAAHLSQNQS
jgi:hypothetical protein